MMLPIVILMWCNRDVICEFDLLQTINEEDGYSMVTFSTNPLLFGHETIDKRKMVSKSEAKPRFPSSSDLLWIS